MYFYRFGLAGIMVVMGGFVFAHPRTDVVVQKPITSTEVSHPTTSVPVTRNKTIVPTFKPVTSVQGAHSTTSVVVSKPSTDTRVFHPTTSVQVTHPGEMPLATTVPAGNSSSAGGKKTAAVNTVPSSSSSTSMSGYQAPKAKDFKAAALGGGAGGLGNKTDEAAKDAAAASFQVPKGEAASLDSVLKSANNVNQSNIAKAIEGKLK